MFAEIAGTIERRILLNCTASESAAQRFLPPSLRPHVVGGRAVVGICFIEMSHIRPSWMPPKGIGLSSRNLAHRTAVITPNGQPAVFIRRRDTDSRVTHLLGGRAFPGRHQLGSFTISDSGSRLRISYEARDGMRAGLTAIRTDDFHSQVFATLEDASEFFEAASLGLSRRARAMEGVTMRPDRWQVRPLEIESWHSSIYANLLADDELVLDCALEMQPTPVLWHRTPDRYPTN